MQVSFSPDVRLGKVFFMLTLFSRVDSKKKISYCKVL